MSIYGSGCHQGSVSLGTRCRTGHMGAGQDVWCLLALSHSWVWVCLLFQSDLGCINHTSPPTLKFPESITWWPQHDWPCPLSLELLRVSFLVAPYRLATPPPSPKCSKVLYLATSICLATPSSSPKISRVLYLAAPCRLATVSQSPNFRGSST